MLAAVKRNAASASKTSDSRRAGDHSNSAAIHHPLTCQARHPAIERKAASQQLNQIAQRNNYRGYDGTQNSSRRRRRSRH